MWFKNAIIYRITKKQLNFNEIEQQLRENAFSPCEPNQSSRFGWAAPLATSENLAYHADGKILLVAKLEEKILPAEVVNRELNKRVQALEEKENRKLKKMEKLSIKDDVIATLLPKAFSRIKTAALFIDVKKQLIYVDAASTKRSEDVLALLRKSLGSLPVVPLSFANEPSIIMQSWITDNVAPQWLTILEEAELRSKADNGIIKCKNQELEAEEILTLTQDKFVTKLALEWEDHLTFVLNDDCSLKRLKFADQIREKNEDILKEDIAQRFDADFVLMTGILEKLTENLLNEFGGEKVRL